MHSFLGVITNTKSEELLEQLTQYRCMSAVPFGGRYRLIDFALSNLVNSGVRCVGVITSHKYRALLDHLGAGKEWGLDRKSDGLFYLPSASPGILRKTFKIDLQDFYVNLDFLENCSQDYVIISGNNMICNMDYEKAACFHRETGADITVCYHEEKVFTPEQQNLTYLELAEDGRVVSVNNIPNRLGNNKISMESLIMKRKLLLRIIELAFSSGIWDLTDILQNNIEQLKIYAFEHKGYLGIINSLSGYFKHSMDLLQKEIWQELFFGHRPIYSKSKDNPPTKYGREAEVSSSLVAAGCSVRGKVEHSIIFRGVTVEKGAVVKNSIVMPKSVIKENVYLENVILDKEVFIRKGAVIKGERGHPIIIGKKTVI